MQGTIHTTSTKTLTVHTYTSPESGLDANTHILEFSSQLFVLDTQYGADFADEAADYAATLGKPISRVYVSHDHPDHFFGAAAFKAPVYALAATRDAIAAAGEQMLANNRAAVGDFVPDSIVIPDHIVEPGIEVVDGVSIEFRVISDTEAAALLTIVVPEERLLIAQDLVYNNLHLFIAEGHLEHWATQIEALRAENFTAVLPGHGAPGGPELFDFVTDYLAVAQPALANAAGPEELNAALITAFPNAGGVGLLHVQNRYIFPSA